MNELIANRYQFNRQADILGRGGMGTVYLGYDNQSQQVVAIKQLNPELVSHYSDSLKRFIREAKVLKDLEHPHIIPIIEAVSDVELGHYIVMAYIEGGTLWDEMQAYPQMPIHRAIDLAKNLASALILVHQNNLIHRDIKPANVLINTHKSPILSDFGVVHLQSDTQITETGTLVGTLDYLSPEMLNGETITSKADIWAFGVMLYEMITGKRPFLGDNPSALITSILTKPMIDIISLPPDVPQSLIRLIEWMLVKEPAHRAGTMEIVLQGLQDISSGQTTLNIPDIRQSQLKRIGSLPKVFSEVHFYNREGHLAAINNFITEGKPFIGVYGRGGIGKTALVCKAMDVCEKNMDMNGVAYLRTNSTPPLNSDRLLEVLCEFLSPSHPFHETRKSAGISMTDKTHALLEALSGGRYLVYLDNLETLQNPDTHTLLDEGLTDFFSVLLQKNTDTLCVIITTRYPLPFPNTIKAYECSVRLDDGLPTQDALFFLREMDKHQVLPQDDYQLHQWIDKVGGYPRGLEALVGYLNGGETRHIDDLFEDSSLFEGEVLTNVVEQVHKALSQDFRWVMTSVAVIGQATTRSELEYLLAPYLETARTRLILERLVEGRFLIYNRQTRAYSLHPIDQAYALSSTPVGSADDAISAFTRYILNDRMTVYYHARRKPEDAWQSLADLEPVLREFEHLFTNGRYDDAVVIVKEIDVKYLMRWGNAQLMFHLHGRLQGKLTNRTMMMQSAGNLGNACWMMGDMKEAKRYYEIALPLSREIGDHLSESRWIGNLGNVSYVMGNSEQAIPYYTQALDLARQLQDKRLMGTWLNNLSNIYSVSGQFETMITCLQESLGLSQEGGNQHAEAISLINLGNAYLFLGENEESNDYYQKALSLSLELQNSPNEALCLTNLGNLYINMGRYDEAFSLLTDAACIATAIHDIRVLQTILLFQTRAHWYRDDLSNALITIQEALTHDVGDNNHVVTVTKGAIFFMQGKPNEAKALLEAGITLVDALLAQSPSLYEAYFTRGTAYLILWMITNQQTSYEQAKTDYQAALAICSAMGIRLMNWEEIKRLLAYSQNSQAENTELAILLGVDVS